MEQQALKIDLMAAQNTSLDRVLFWLNVAAQLVIGVWLGTMVCFSFLLAPTAFQPNVLPTRHLSGAIVGSVLGKVEWFGIVAGITLAILLGMMIWLRQERRKRSSIVMALVPVAMAIDCMASKWLVSTRMSDLRVAMGNIDQTALTDPLRIAFNQYHQYSVWLMSFNLMAAILVLIWHVQVAQGTAGNSTTWQNGT